MSSDKEEDPNAEEASQAGRDRGEAAPGRCADIARQVGGHAIRAIGVTEVTYYRWRQEYGGLRSNQVKRIRIWRRRTPFGAQSLI
jgi:hypothetical protein